jgi:hypothetical protein
MTLLLVLPASPGGRRRVQAASFPTASVIFEQNATDGDVEVVFKVKGRNEGLAKLSVVSPDGRTVIDFAAPGASALGIREFVFESPEPKDVAGLKAAYPAGVYRFAGATAAGQQLHGESTLGHELPATTSFLRPGAGARNVPVEDLEIAWTPVAKVSGYVIEIEQDDLGVHLEASLPGSAAASPLTATCVRTGDLGIGTVSEAETSRSWDSFTTAGRRGPITSASDASQRRGKGAEACGGALEGSGPDRETADAEQRLDPVAQVVQARRMDRDGLRLTTEGHHREDRVGALLCPLTLR